MTIYDNSPSFWLPIQASGLFLTWAPARRLRERSSATVGHEAVKGPKAETETLAKEELLALFLDHRPVAAHMGGDDRSVSRPTATGTRGRRWRKISGGAPRTGDFPSKDEKDEKNEISPCPRNPYEGNPFGQLIPKNGSTIGDF